MNCLLVVILIKGSLNLGTLCNTGCENKHVVSLVSLIKWIEGGGSLGAAVNHRALGQLPSMPSTLLSLPIVIL